MGRKSALLLFWIAGFMLGAFAWFLRTPLVQLIESIGLTSDASQGLVAGFFGSAVMVLAVLVWSFLSSPSEFST